MSAPRFLQRFEILDELGSGAMGTVVRARDPQLEREVAIKILHHATQPAREELASRRTINLRDDASRDDLLHEARIMARLAHPNVVPVYEVGIAGDDVFVVMELVAGADLRAWLDAPRPAAEIAAVLAQAGRGLAAAHEQGIVHRDFKPENVLIGRDGRARVADFGLSRLVAPAAGVHRVAEHAGTPRYMAPELWRGEPATAASDVFAYCTVIDEVLVEPRVAALVAAGLRESPADRPAAIALVRALEAPRPPRRGRWPVVAAAGAAAVAAVAVVLAVSAGSSDAPCAADPSVLAGRWDPDRRAALERALQARPGAAIAATTARVLGVLDDHQAAIAATQVATCSARRRGELSEAQALGRASCAERRAMELGAFVHDQLAAAAWDLPRAEARARALTPPAVCDQVERPALPRDRAAVAALYDRHAALDRGPAGEQAAALAALERDAAALGEHELEARAALGLGIRLRADDHLDEADTALQRAYVRAHDDRDADTEARVLIERSTAAGLHGDSRLAQVYAQLALDLAQKPATPAATRAQIYAQLGRAERRGGHYDTAAAHLRTGLDLIARSGEPMVDTTIRIQSDLVGTLTELRDYRAAIELGTRSLGFIRDHLGEHSAAYGVALGVLAYPYRRRLDLKSGIRYATASLAVQLEVLPPDHSQVMAARLELANALATDGQYALALEQARAALAQTEHNQALRIQRPDIAGTAALALFNLGQWDEAIRQLAASVEDGTSIDGADHPRTLLFRENLAAYRLELDRLDEAATDLEAIERGYRSHPLTSDLRPAHLAGTVAAELAIARGRPRDAEAMTRRALAEVTELGGGSGERRPILWTLAASLVAQGRFADAQPPLAEAMALSAKDDVPENFRVLDDVLLGQIEYGLGHRAAGLALVRHARDVLDEVQGQPKARRQIAAFLATHR